MDPLAQNPLQLGPAAAGLPGTAQDPGAAGPLSGGGPALEYPLRPVVQRWIEKLKVAEEHKERLFGRQARECMAFYDGDETGSYDFLYTRKYNARAGGFARHLGDETEWPAPTFQMTVNKAAELVQIFGPVLYHKNPNRQVNPRELPDFPPEAFGLDPADPAAAPALEQLGAQAQATRTLDRARATLIQWYLNYTPVELDLKAHCRRAVDEGLIKGMGLLWTEVYEPKGATVQDAAGVDPMTGQPTPGPPRPLRLVGSFEDSVDNLLLDPDGETLEACKWAARRCTHPVWEVEDDYGLPRGTLRANYESGNRRGEVNASPDAAYDRAKGSTNDLFVYWKIWSKMGVGHRLGGAPRALDGVLDQFGDYCYLAVAEDVPYPLNLSPQALAAPDPESALRRLDWPTPFWLDDAWPFTPVAFHDVPRRAWPMSHLKPALGELRFLNWVFSFLAGKIRSTCRDFIAVPESLADDLAEQLLHGRDMELLKIKADHGDIAKLIHTIQFPTMNGDVWRVVEAVIQLFERRTGLTELVYGESATQLRSAEEAHLKGAQLQVRPDDMAQRVEDAMTAVARKEALAARWHVREADVREVMGPTAAGLWGRLVNSADVYAVVRQLEYRIEAGSTRKPNKDRDAANARDAMQQLFAPLFQYGMATGNVAPVNNLLTFWARTVDLDAGGFLLAPPPTPMPPGGEGGGGPPAKRAA